MTVRRAHHRDLDALAAQACDAAGPLALDDPLALEFQAQDAEERNHRLEVLDDDAHVVHPLHCHATTLSRRASHTEAAAAKRHILGAARVVIDSQTP